MILDIGEKDKVVGQIYKMTNTTNGKVYIGQTRSHRLNHNKYRPFGYLGRFKDHIYEAFSSKKNHCKCLNSAIRKYGQDSFTCELIHTCDVDDLNEQEEQFAKKMVPKERLGQAEDIAGSCIYLCAQASSWMTGHTLVLDGGVIASSSYGEI